MRISEIHTEKTGWEAARPKVARALSSMSKKLGGEMAPNKSGFDLYTDLGQGHKLGWNNMGWLGVRLDVSFRQNGAYGGNRIHAGVNVGVSGETVRNTMDGPIENERYIDVWTEELDPKASEADILALIPKLQAALPKALEIYQAEIAKLQKGPNRKK